MRTYLVQSNPTVGAIDQNLRGILKNIEAAKAVGAELVAFPELALSGAPLNDLLFHQDIVMACEKALQEIARASHGIIVVVGSPGTDGRSVFDGAILFYNGEEVGRQHDVCWRWEVGGKRLGVIIGEGEVEDFSEQADMIIHLAASPWSPGIEEHRRATVAHRARTLHLPYLFVNLVGGNDGWIFDGGSFLCEAEGNVVFQAPSFREYAAIAGAGGIASIATPRREVLEAIVLGIRDFFAKQQISDALIGLSGGIDSSVVATLASLALGPSHVHGVLLPSKWTTPESTTGAQALCQNLGISMRTIPIESVVESASGTLASVGVSLGGLAAENIQSRSRSLMLMALANTEGSFVLGTSNKSEIALGYATLYGDVCGALLPIGDLFKTEVYELAAYLNEEKELIPTAILQRAPTAELRAGQKDSDDLPEYTVLDPVLRLLLLEGLSPEEVSAQTGMRLSTVRMLAKRIMQFEFKRRQAPCILRLSSKAFGTEIVYPIVNRWYLPEI